MSSTRCEIGDGNSNGSATDLPVSPQVRCMASCWCVAGRFKLAWDWPSGDGGVGGVQWCSCEVVVQLLFSSDDVRPADE